MPRIKLTIATLVSIAFVTASDTYAESENPTPPPLFVEQTDKRNAAVVDSDDAALHQPATPKSAIHDRPDNRQLLQFSRQTCKSPDTIETTASELFQPTADFAKHPIQFRGTDVGQRVEISIVGSLAMEIQLLTPPARRNQYVLTTFYSSSIHRLDNATGSTRLAELQLALDADCKLQRARRIVYNKADGSALYIESLDSDLSPVGSKDWLNPDLPATPTVARSGIRVAMVDSGVNYQLESIAESLARDEQGHIIGFDFWDMDDRPYDANPARSPFFAQRHGTRTASILLREAPDVALVPYRYPRPDMTRMAQLVEHAASNQVRIVGMPLGSNNYSDWTSFATAARENSQLLFIVSAGNNGRDIDQSPVYPAAMEIDNMIVVTSADDFVKPAERTNFGRLSVDYLLPAESIPALDYSGEQVRVSGSSYAVSRVVALAARLLNKQPAMTTAQLKNAIGSYSTRANTARYVAIGYLGDPLADSAIVNTETIKGGTGRIDQTTRYEMAVHVVILDDRWTPETIDKAFTRMNTIFSQCDLSVVAASTSRVETSRYLKDLSTSNVYTLKRALDLQGPVVYFGRDTVMETAFDAEAFGIGNTRNRPWMTNTLWLTAGIRDAGIALAHEFFHIIANNGAHSTQTNNLLRDQSLPENTVLTAEQCELAVSTGLANNLLM